MQPFWFQPGEFAVVPRPNLRGLFWFFLITLKNRGPSPLHPSQMCQKRLDPCRAKATRVPPAVEQHQSSHPIDIRVLGADAVVQPPDARRTSSSSFGLGAPPEVQSPNALGCIAMVDTMAKHAVALPGRALGTPEAQNKTPFGVSIYS